LMYSDDHDGLLPGVGHGVLARELSWIKTLAPYLGGAAAIRACPSDERWRERLENGGASYVLNGFTAVEAVDPFGQELPSFRNLNGILRPTETFVLFEIADRSEPTNFKDHTHSRAWLNGWGFVLLDIQPDRHRSGSASPDHTRGSANYLFADGHIGLIHARAFKEILDRGINPAEPPK
jgi:prepilin-type processing-associated H-X9-DG protein